MVARRTRRGPPDLGSFRRHMSIPTSATPVRDLKELGLPRNVPPGRLDGRFVGGPRDQGSNRPLEGQFHPPPDGLHRDPTSSASVPSQGPTDSKGGHARVHPVGTKEQEGVRGDFGDQSPQRPSA